MKRRRKCIQIMSLMTAHQGIGEDAAVFFKNMSIGNLDGEYHHLIVSPFSLKRKVLRHDG